MANGFLLDTMTISEATKSNINPGVASWLEHVDETRTFISVLTVGEVQKGIDRLDRNSPRRVVLEHWLVYDLLGKFGRRVLAFDVNAARLWGSLVASALSRQLTLPIIDSQIAAIASLHGLTIVTRNDKHFSDVGATTLNPWM